MTLSVLAQGSRRGALAGGGDAPPAGVPGRAHPLSQGRGQSAIRRQNDNPRQAAAASSPGSCSAIIPTAGRRIGNASTRSPPPIFSRDFHARYYVPDNLFIAVSGDIAPEGGRSAEPDAGRLGGGQRPFPNRHPDGGARGPAVVSTRATSPRPPSSTAAPRSPAAPISTPPRCSTTSTGAEGVLEPADPAGSRSGGSGLLGAQFLLPTGRKDAAPFTVSCQTKTETTVDALMMMREIMVELAAAPVAPGDFEAARGALVNGFVGLVTREAVVTALMGLEFEGRPADFYGTYLDRIRAVTPEDARVLAERIFDPDRMITVLVGDVEAFAPDLSGLGTVESRALPEPELD